MSPLVTQQPQQPHRPPWPPSPYLHVGDLVPQHLHVALRVAELALEQTGALLQLFERLVHTGLIVWTMGSDAALCGLAWRDVWDGKVWTSGRQTGSHLYMFIHTWVRDGKHVGPSNTST